jgi:hypothetical protein
MTYFSPLRRLSPTIEFIHHPNLDLFSDHRKSLELFRNLLKSHWTKVHLKSDPNTFSLLARSGQSAWPFLLARPPRAPSPPQPAQPLSGLCLPANPNQHHRLAHMASRPAWPKRPTVPASTPTSVRCKPAAITSIAPSRRFTKSTMAAPISSARPPPSSTTPQSLFPFNPSFNEL